MPKTDQGIEVSLKRDRYTVIPRTLVFITRGGRVLLLRGSAQTRIWANKYNGIGGHIERDEDIYSAARREVLEETSLEVENLRLVGLINIDGDAPTGIMLFVFAADSRSGEPVPSAEGTLEWIEYTQITQVDLVEDLPIILPRAIHHPIGAAPFFAHYRYTEQDQLVIRFAEG
ncbi:MAG: NUDIX domain-containing protein [Thermoflexales bacterium]|nr:NUDIX domain-containing protein [Thermoflexales bacterium]